MPHNSDSMTPTKRRNALRSSIFVLVVVVLISWFSVPEGGAQGFQWPEEPENLEVLPDGVKGRELGAVMRGFATALGVRCQHCHGGKAGQELKPFDLMTFDFASDEKPAKEKARLMLNMVKSINEKQLAGLSDWGVPSSERLQVTCITCHRGQAKPRMLGDVLAQVIEEEGVGAAKKKYNELREEFYGGFSYDFSERVLTRVAETLAKQGQFTEAIELIELELEYHPESLYAHFVLAGAYKESGNKDAAIEILEKALSFASDAQKPFLQKQLEELKGS